MIRDRVVFKISIRANITNMFLVVFGTEKLTITLTENNLGSLQLFFVNSATGKEYQTVSLFVIQFFYNNLCIFSGCDLS